MATAAPRPTVAVLDDFPPEVVLHVIRYTDLWHVCRLATTCTAWRQFIEEWGGAVWRAAMEHSFGGPLGGGVPRDAAREGYLKILEKCRAAGDRTLLIDWTVDNGHYRLLSRLMHTAPGPLETCYYAGRFGYAREERFSMPPAKVLNFLHTAVRKNYPGLVVYLLEVGAFPTVESKQMLLLRNGVATGDRTIVHGLLETMRVRHNGQLPAAIDTEIRSGQWLLIAAGAVGSRDLCLWLLGQGSPLVAHPRGTRVGAPAEAAAVVACRVGDTAVVQLLLDAEPSPPLVACFHAAAATFQLAVLRLLATRDRNLLTTPDGIPKLLPIFTFLRNNNGHGPLHPDAVPTLDFFIETMGAEAVLKLRNPGNQATILFVIFQTCQPKFFEHALRNTCLRAQVNEPAPQTGETFLHVTYMDPASDITDLVLECGGRIQPDRFGQTPIFRVASGHRKKALMAKFLAAGDDINHVARDGSTPLLHVRSPDALLPWLTAGADFSVHDARGWGLLHHMTLGLRGAWGSMILNDYLVMIDALGLDMTERASNGRTILAMLSDDLYKVPPLVMSPCTLSESELSAARQAENLAYEQNIRFLYDLPDCEVIGRTYLPLVRYLINQGVDPNMVESADQRMERFNAHDGLARDKQTRRGSGRQLHEQPPAPVNPETLLGVREISMERVWRGLEAADPVRAAAWQAVKARRLAAQA